MSFGLESEWRGGKLSHHRHYFASYIRVISLSPYLFSLSKHPTYYKVYASVSRAFTARNPISMKRRNKRLRRETNIAFQGDTPPRGYAHVVCVNSSGLSVYSRENLTVLSRKQEVRNHYRNSACLLTFRTLFQSDYRESEHFGKELEKTFTNLFVMIKLKL